MSVSNVDPAVQAHQAFVETYGFAPEFNFRAPGRVNLIGEHTDYNKGFVLPVAINFYTAIAASPRNDSIINVMALNENGSKVSINLDEAQAFDHDNSWSNYLRGVIRELRAEGYKLCGADLVISGNVPLGAGLSSSAALEIVTVSALTKLSGETIDGILAAKVGQRAENNFCGCSCGIMDQLVIALGESENAMLLDCQSLDYKSVTLPEKSSLIIINSNVKRGLVDSEYNVRREQCEEVASFFGTRSLRGITLNDLEANKSELDPVSYKRALHVLTENERTLKAAEVLASGELKKLGSLMAASHLSMKDDFEITVPPIDTLVDIVKDVIGDEGGVRMTGGGFGGCIVALVPEEYESQVIEQVNNQYPELTGLQASIFVCKASPGAFS